MCSMMAIIAAKSDYIYKANLIYANLIKHEEVFEIEAQIISHVKCSLLRNEKLDDFYISGIEVDVYQTSNGYELYFDNYHIDIQVYDKQIVGFEISAA